MVSAAFTEPCLSFKIFLVNYDMFLMEETLKFYEAWIGAQLLIKRPLFFNVEGACYEDIKADEVCDSSCGRRWHYRLAVDELFFHVEMFNCQNLLLLSPMLFMPSQATQSL